MVISYSIASLSIEIDMELKPLAYSQMKLYEVDHSWPTIGMLIVIFGLFML